jgi:curved DNA-binding protein
LAAHPDFRARDADLYYDLDLAPWEAVLGTTLTVPTLGGRVKVRIPPGTNNGQQLRVREQGLPKGKSGERGDLYVVANVQVPQQSARKNARFGRNSAAHPDSTRGGQPNKFEA